jgi:hypothetical protein
MEVIALLSVAFPVLHPSSATAGDPCFSFSPGGWSGLLGFSGEIEGMDGSTQESLTISLGTIRHAVCQRALERLTGQKEAKQ